MSGRAADTVSALSESASVFNDLSPKAIRQLLASYPTGVAVVTTRAPDGQPIGLTINSFASLSLDPPLVLWSLEKRSINLSSFCVCRHFAISVLSDKQEYIARQFANPKLPNKFADVRLQRTAEGLPSIDDALAVLVCAREESRIVGDHLLLIGRVVRTINRNGKPLVFYGGRFTSIDPQDGRSESLRVRHSAVLI